MPNHVHSVLEIVDAVGTRRDLSASSGMWTGGDLSDINNRLHNQNVIPGHGSTTQSNHKIKSLSELVGAFKTTSSKEIRRAGLVEFAWQRSFHDHIIRTETAYRNIVTYILTNPERRNTDSF